MLVYAVIRITGAFTLIGLVLVVGLYVAVPPLLDRVVPRHLQTVGISHSEFSFGRPGLQGLTIHHAVINTGGIRLTASETQLTYNLPLLWAGRVDQVYIKELDLVVGGSTDAGESAAISSVWSQMPANLLQVESMSVESSSPPVSITGTFSIDKQRINSELHIQTPQSPMGLDAVLKIDKSGETDLTITSSGESSVITLSGHPGEFGNFLLTGDLSVQDETFIKFADLAGVEGAHGFVRGKFEGSLPWPMLSLPNPDEIRGSVSLDVAIELPGPFSINEDTQVSGGRVAGELGISLDGADAKFTSNNLTIRASQIHHQNRTYDVQVNDLNLTSDIYLPWPMPKNIIQALSGICRLGLDTIITTRDPIPGKAEIFGVVTAEANDGQIAIRVDEGTSVELVRGNSVGIQTGRPVEVRFEPESGIVSTTDALLFLRASDWPLIAGQRLSFQKARLEVAELSMKNNHLESRGQFSSSDSDQALPISYRVSVHTSDLKGEFSIGVDHRLLRPLVANELPGWLSGYDLDSGELQLTLAGNFEAADKILINGDGSLALSHGTAHYEDIAASGIDARMPIEFHDSAIRLGPGQISAGVLEADMPISNIQFDLQTDLNIVRLDDVSANLLGARIAIDQMTYDISSGISQFEVEVLELPVASILALEGEDVVGDGLLDGRLPVTMSRKGPTINGGSLVSRAPGGHLSYTGAVPTTNPALDLAMSALGDFNYEQMDIDVNYQPDGLLALLVRLEGNSPDVENGRPIHFNLNVTENIPDLLESLRASGDLSERVQQRLSQ